MTREELYEQFAARGFSQAEKIFDSFSLDALTAALNEWDDRDRIGLDTTRPGLLKSLVEDHEKRLSITKIDFSSKGPDSRVGTAQDHADRRMQWIELTMPDVDPELAECAIIALLRDKHPVTVKNVLKVINYNVSIGTMEDDYNDGLPDSPLPDESLTAYRERVSGQSGSFAKSVATL